jgi:catechol 2,3-dioxygenase-like lactoylglutathione lyase family enzyme
MGLSSYAVSASIAVSDMTRSEAFYEGTLGLSGSADQRDGSHRYTCGDGTSLHVYESPANAGRATPRSGVSGVKKETEESWSVP